MGVRRRFRDTRLRLNQQRDQQRGSPAHDIEHIRTDESLQFRAKRFYH